MDNDFFMSAGLQQQHWQQSLSSTAMQIHPSDTSCFNPNWDTNALSDHHHHHHSQGGGHFESARSSMVSSPAAPNSSYISNESVLIRELIGKLGNMGNPPDASSSPGGPCNPAICYNGSNSTNTSCYSTPLSSPPKVNFPVMDHLVKERFSSVAEFTADPGFAERAARFSCFGSRSFNGRTAQLSLNNNCSNDNGDPRFESNPAMTMTANSKFQRVSSSPSLEALAGSQGSLQPNGNSRLPDRNESMVSNSNEESSVSEQIPGGGENGSKASNEANSRKRKAAPKGRAKDSVPPSPSAATAVQVDESNDNPSPKRSKQSNGDGKENESVKAEDNGAKTDAKPPEPPKDYIHVRARRGQATDSHSLAERVRREKISERMKLLQDLVPGCNKVTGKALMLDEIINYVQSLQRQVEFLSMKLASVNTSLDFNSDGLISKDVFQSSNSIAHHLLALDSSVATFHGQRPLNPPAMAPLVQGHVSNGTPTGIDPLNLGPGHNLEPHLHQLNELQNFCGDDLQSIVQMGFGQNSSQETAFHVQSFRG